MIEAKLPSNEVKRIKALNSYKILDTLPEEDYDRLTFIASHICDTPIALVSLIDPKRQWFKSHHGLDATETPREFAFCAHAINSPDEVLIIPDARKDERFHDNPLTTDAPNVIFYAGAPLVTSEGYSLGTICVIDNQPRTITEKQISALKALANQVVALLELRKKNKELEDKNNQISNLNKELESFSYRLSHDLKTPIRGINNISEWILDDEQESLSTDAKKNIELISARSKYMMSLINSMISYSKVKKENIHSEHINLKELSVIIANNCNDGHNYELSFTNCDQLVYTSKTVLSICLQNLITNSLKFSNKPICKINIELKETEKELQIHFNDNGVSISEKYSDKIFELFETVGPKNENSTGIGLATVKETLRRIDGTIALNSDCKAEGCSFTITIPK